MDFLRKIYTFLIDIIQSLLLVFSIFLVVYIFLFRPFQVSGNSMYPNYHDKQYILTNIIALKISSLKRGDVVVFRAPRDMEKDYIKRVIGLPGDTIMLKDGNVYVNNVLLDESAYLNSNVRTYGGLFLKENNPTTVTQNTYFVLGDNRTGSSDSREWGFVSLSLIVGKSLFVYWPLNEMGIVKNPYDL
jgi:signal peptidase I